MSKKVSVVERIYNANDQLALENRAKLDEAGLLTLNLMASPGAGKTSLIESTLRAIGDRYKIAVIDGDIASSIDADRAAAAGATAVQINTGGSCHLDANMLRNALAQLDLEKFDLLIIENVGNLICPAGFQIGAHKNILIASTPEGDDKPYKYPTMYQNVDVLIINKIDLLSLLSFDMDYFQKGVEILSPGLDTFPLSCQTREGFDAWLNWLTNAIAEF